MFPRSGAGELALGRRLRSRSAARITAIVPSRLSGAGPALAFPAAAGRSVAPGSDGRYSVLASDSLEHKATKP